VSLIHAYPQYIAFKILSFCRNTEQLACQHCKKAHKITVVQYINPQWMSIKKTDFNDLLPPCFSFPKAHQQTIKPGFPATIIHSGFFRLRRPLAWNSDMQNTLTVITALHFPNGWLQSSHILHRRLTMGGPMLDWHKLKTQPDYEFLPCLWLSYNIFITKRLKSQTGN
jgi:hypothetical protein